MSYTIINIGVEANDGTGSPLRTAFDTVNDNFQIVNDGLYAGTRQTIISALSVQSDTFVSNTYILANTYVSANNLIGNTVTSNGNLYVSQGGAYIFGNVNIIGNLNVSGSQAASQSQQSGAPILALHYSATPLVVDDGKDIGTEWQYYNGAAERKAFLGWQNSSRSLVYLDDITDTANVITAGYFGNMQIGSLTISNTTSSTSNVTGALQVAGGAGIQGNVYVQSNVFVGNNANIGNITVRGYHVGTLRFSGADTVTINGSPVQTAAQAFNGGTVGLATVFADATASTGLGTGAVRIAGGFSANGNVFVSNLHTITGGNIRSNIIGNVITNTQPFITSLGTLTGLTVSGQSTMANIIPTVDNQQWLGTPSSRWVQGHFFNLTASQINGATSFNAVTNFSSNVLATSGTDSVNKTTGAIVITGFGGLGVGGTVHVGGNVYIDNVNDASGLIASTSSAYVFNENASTVAIAAAGQTLFGNTLQATSTISGAVRLTDGGMSITQGNLYIGGSAGNAVIATGNIHASGNLVTLSNVFASGNIVGSYEASRGFLGNLFGSPITGNTHIGAHLLPTANVRYSVGSQLRRYETFWANVTNSLFVESANVTTANIITESGAFTGVVTALTAPSQTANTMIATTEFVSSALTSAINSPTFTGVPTAPTAASGTSNTQIATTAFASNANNLTAGSVPYDRLPAGSILQVVHVAKTNTFTGTSVVDNGGYFIDVTGLSATITPRSSTSKILIITNMYVGATVAASGYQQSYRLKRTIGATVTFPILGDAEGGRPRATGRINMYGNATYLTYNMQMFSGTHQDSPGTTSAITYQIQLGGYSGSPVVYLNRSETFQNSASNYDAVPVSTITLMEVAV